MVCHDPKFPATVGSRHTVYTAMSLCSIEPRLDDSWSSKWPFAAVAAGNDRCSLWLRDLAGEALLLRERGTRARERRSAWRAFKCALATLSARPPSVSSPAQPKLDAVNYVSIRWLWRQWVSMHSIWHKSICFTYYKITICNVLSTIDSAVEWNYHII